MPNPVIPQPAPAFPRRPARGGFTLIEMLVVIGIILLLIGISIGGFSQVAKHSKAQHTKAALEAVKSMMGEFEATVGKQGMGSFKSTWDSVATAIDARRIALVTVPNVSPPPITWQTYTDLVLAKLLEIQNNKAILDKLPSEQVKPVTLPNGNSSYEILDGYGHPLQFVPSIGLRNVTAGGVAGIIRSDGRVHIPADPYPNPNPRYFWVSFGADGDAAAGDDNAYSFDQ